MSRALRLLLATWFALLCVSLPSEALTNAQRVEFFSGALPPAISMNFANNAGSGSCALSGVPTPCSNLYTISRTSAETCTDASGNVTYVTNNVACINSAGFGSTQPASTNLLKQSSSIGTTPWTTNTSGTGSTVSLTANYAVAPDGTATAALIAVARTASTGGAYLTQTWSDSVTSNYIDSIYLKANSTGDVGVPVNIAVWNGSAFIGIEQVVLTSGWTRFATKVVNLGGPYAGLQFVVGLVPGTQYVGSVGILAWGAQAEQQVVATALIPTTTTTASRSADAVTAAGALATALAKSNMGVTISSIGGSSSKSSAGVTATPPSTLLDANGTVLLGINATDNLTTAQGTTLTSTLANYFGGTVPVSIGFNNTPSGGSLELNGVVNSDAVARTPTGPFHIGSTSGSSAFWVGSIANITVTTPAAALPNNGAAITSLAFGTAFKYNSNYPTTSVGTDTWGSTWCDDGNIYTSNDDMDAGWNGASANSNFAISKLSTYTTSVVGSLVNNMQANFGDVAEAGSDGYNYKAEGSICVNGVLYTPTSRTLYAVTPLFQQYQVNSQLIKSSDHGGTWTPLPPSSGNPYASPMFPGASFGAPFPIQYGQNYSGQTVDNSANYVYWMSSDFHASNANYMYLARVSIANIGNLNASQYTYYCGNGVSGMNDSAWCSSATQATPIFSNPGQLGQGGAQYIPSLGRYLSVGTFYPTANLQIPSLTTSNTTWSIYEAPHPWGPWSLVQQTNWSGACLGYYFPVIIPPSVSGLTATIATDGDYTNTTVSTGCYTLTLIPITISHQ